jgi:hypothetical protein
VARKGQRSDILLHHLFASKTNRRHLRHLRFKIRCWPGLPDRMFSNQKPKFG